MVFDVEEVVGPQMVVPGLVTGVDRGGVDGDGGLGVRRIFPQLQGSFEGAEPTRTLDTAMCRTAKPNSVWEGSMS